MEYMSHYDSPLGAITLASDGCALTGLWFDGQAHFGETLDAVHEEKDLPVFQKAKDWLDLYFSGKVPTFTPPLAPKGTPFRQAVWQVLLTIPYGHTTTYGAIAEKLTAYGFPKASPRAVGGAVGHNPIALLIPCHRVVGKDGRLTGYAAGVERKKWLLERERENIEGKKG